VSTRAERESTSPLGVAGWLYADLFLALVVVGLAAMTFRTSSPPNEEAQEVAATTTTASVSNRQFQLSCTEAFMAPEILGNEAGRVDRVTRFLKETIQDRGWTLENAKPGLVFVYGGYDDESERADNEAADLASKLTGEVPLLAKVEIRSGARKQLAVNGRNIPVGGSGSFAAIVYFVYQGEPEKESCGS